jgi:antitoxin component YwqK of YwqJK toxin-antitoxin module
MEWNYKNGKREGISKLYYEGGMLEAERRYGNDKLEGITKVYYKDGTIKYIENYKDGQMINRKKYDEQGNLVKE